ncbi:MAG: DEAD/DEAH box helicase [Clostridiales bacterium]|nr:DEAD/DEAH box helicase [Clostridiales bacterium]
MNKFKALGINETLIDLLSKQGITVPTSIQTQTIPKVLEGVDIIAKAKTGTGKTLAFLLPMIQEIDDKSSEVQGLILSPTRELAIQITDEARKLNVNGKLNILAVHGGIDINSQLRKLGRSPNLVIATPGRLMDHLRRETIKLDQLKFAVLDEADQMLQFGFKNDIEIIMDNTNKDKQLLCFSATIDSKVKKLAYKYMNNPYEIQLAEKNIPLELIEQKIILTTDRWKQEALLKELDRVNPFLSIVFCRTKRRADILETAMFENGYDCKKLHGDMKQKDRQRVMKAFKNADFQYLIATDVAARGLDITGVTHIYNYDMPETVEGYIHRIGRTGRMDKTGIAITIATPKDEDILEEIEKSIGKTLIKVEHIHKEGKINRSYKKDK